MLKWILPMLLMSTLCIGVQVEYSVDNATWYNVTDINETTMKAYQVTLNEGTLYYFRATNDTENWTYASARTETSGERQMASLAIVAFITVISFFMMFLHRIIVPLSKNPWINEALKGCTITIGIFLLSMAVSIVASMSAFFGFGLEKQILSLMFLTNWGGYVAMVMTVLVFGFKALGQWQMQKYNKRFGEDEDSNAPAYRY